MCQAASTRGRRFTPDQDHVAIAPLIFEFANGIPDDFVLREITDRMPPLQFGAQAISGPFYSTTESKVRILVPMRLFEKPVLAARLQVMSGSSIYWGWSSSTGAVDWTTIDGEKYVTIDMNSMRAVMVIAVDAEPQDIRR